MFFGPGKPGYSGFLRQEAPSQRSRQQHFEGHCATLCEKIPPQFRRVCGAGGDVMGGWALGVELWWGQKCTSL